jgi:hypothetical protein
MEDFCNYLDELISKNYTQFLDKLNRYSVHPRFCAS